MYERLKIPESYVGTDYEQVAKFCVPKVREFFAARRGDALDVRTAMALEEHLRVELRGIPPERRGLLNLPFEKYQPRVEVAPNPHQHGDVLNVYTGSYLFVTLAG